MPHETPEERAHRRKRLQFLCNSKDPEAMECRLFISGLDTNVVDKPAVINLFTPYGRVYDVSIHKGFVFAQYDNMASSLAAIQNLNGTVFSGRTLNVKLAADKGGKPPPVAQQQAPQAAPAPGGRGRPPPKVDEQCRFFQFGKCMRGDSCFYRHDDGNAQGNAGPPGHRERPREPEFHKEAPPPARQPRFPGNPRGEGGGLLPPPARASAPGPRPVAEMDRRERGGGLLPPSDRAPKRPMPADFDDPIRRPEYNQVAGGYHQQNSSAGRPLATTVRRSMPESAQPSRAPQAQKPAGMAPAAAAPRRDAPPVDLRPPYDLVLIAGHEAQRTYCMQIEKKLVEFGMLTNVQVVDGEHLLKRAVEEAARHTVPYTICVTANNEEHRSLTLNILHGVAQEHRNMPLEDAMPFLSRNFDNFVEMMKQKISAVNEWVPPDSKVTYLLNLLADGRRLTVPELSEIQTYVQGALSKMQSVESAAGNAGNIVSGLRDPGRPAMVPMPEKERGYPRQHLDQRMSDLEMRGGSNRSQLLPEPSRQEYYPKSGTMQDIVNSGGLDRGDGMNGRHEMRSNHQQSQSMNAQINFSDPSVQRALDGLLSSRSAQHGGNRGYF